MFAALRLIRGGDGKDLKVFLKYIYLPVNGKAYWLKGLKYSFSTD